MSSESKSILDEIQKQFAEQNRLIEQRFTDSESKWERRFLEAESARDARVAVVETVAAALEDWRPGIDGVVDDLKLEVRKLSCHWERSVRNMASVDPRHHRSS